MPQTLNGRALLSAWKPRLKEIPGATFVLILTAIMGRAITFGTQITIAQVFGLSVFADAYFAIENIPELFMDFVATGFSMVFIPMLAEYQSVGKERDARRFAGSFFMLSTLIAVALAVIAALAAPAVVRLVAPGFQGMAREIAIDLTRIISLSIVFFGIDAGIRGMLQWNREFVIPELARLSYNSTLLALALFLSARFGVTILAWGIVFGAICQLTIQLVGAVRRDALKLEFAFDGPGTWRAAKRLLPFVIAVSGVKIVLMIDRIVASGLSEGSIAALNFASRIILLPVGLIALPFRTTLYPDCSALAAQRKFRELAATLQSVLRILILLIIPCCTGLAVLHVPIIRLFFERGAFDSAATLSTGAALITYAIGAPAIAIIFILTTVFLSLGDAITPVKLFIVSWLTNLALSLILGRYTQHYGIALGTSITVIMTAILMIGSLKRQHLKSLDIRALSSATLKVTLVSAIMGLLLLVLLTVSSTTPVAPSLFVTFAQVVVLALAGALIFLLVSRLFRLEEITMFYNAIANLFR